MKVIPSYENLHQEALRRLIDASRAKPTKRDADCWYYSGHVPGREDNKPSLSIIANADGFIHLKDWTGKMDEAAIAAAAGVQPEDLRPIKRETRALTGPGLTLKEFAESKKFPIEWLRTHGVSEGEYNGKPCVKFIQKDMDGAPTGREQLRYHPKAVEGTRWNQGQQPVGLYGQENLKNHTGPLVFAEGNTDYLTLLFHEIRGYVALGFPGAQTVKHLEPRHVEHANAIVACNDGDEAGRKFVADIAARLREFGWEDELREAVVSNHKPGLKDVHDLHADCHKRAGGEWQRCKELFANEWADIVTHAKTIDLSAARVEGASEPWDDPVPLGCEAESADGYPFDALGERLGGAARVACERVQCPDGIAGNAFLAVASLCVQHLADVSLPHKDRIPCSLFLLSVAETGERKTTVDQAAQKELLDVQRGLEERYEQDIEIYRFEKACYDREVEKAVKSKSASRAHPRSVGCGAMELAAGKPSKPPCPQIVFEDVTFDGLVKQLIHSQPTIGLFSGEGARVVFGHSMKSEQRLRTVAGFSQFWDGSLIDRIRVSEGVHHITGKRLTMHVQLQPGMARKFLTDACTLDQGLLSRFLIVWPNSRIGRREYTGLDPADAPEIKAFHERVRQLLERPATGKPRLLGPPLDGEAQTEWIAFYDEIERSLGEGGKYAQLRHYANKAAENAARIACVIQIFENPDAQSIEPWAMRGGIAVAKHCLREIDRFAGRNCDANAEAAQKILDWIVKSGLRTITSVDLGRRAPKECRQKPVWSSAMRILEEHHFVRRSKYGVSAKNQSGQTVLRKNAWEVHPQASRSHKSV